jgi:Rod binding domain-containing protein
MEIAALAGALTPADKPEDVQKATREFEALWIETMLRTARPASDATLTGEADSTRDMVLDMADQQIARLLASQGGLGLARLVGQGLGSPRPATGSGATDRAGVPSATAPSPSGR